MNAARFNAFCAALPHTSHVVQWGGADVWKVGGKLFAVRWEGQSHVDGITFKATPMSFDILKTQPGLRPAPYMASRGMKWLQWFSPATLDEAALQDYLRASYDLVFAALPQKQRVALAAENANVPKKHPRKTP